MRENDLPTASTLAQARETIRGIEPGQSDQERDLIAAMRRTVGLIKASYALVDEIEDQAEQLWNHFDFLVAHRLRIRALDTLATDILEVDPLAAMIRGNAGHIAARIREGFDEGDEDISSRVSILEGGGS